MGVHLWCGNSYSSWNGYGKNPASKLKKKKVLYQYKKSNNIIVCPCCNKIIDRTMYYRLHKKNCGLRKKVKVVFWKCPVCHNFACDSKNKKLIDYHIKYSCRKNIKESSCKKNETKITKPALKESICKNCINYDISTDICRFSQSSHDLVKHCTFFKLH